MNQFVNQVDAASFESSAAIDAINNVPLSMERNSDRQNRRWQSARLADRTSYLQIHGRIERIEISRGPTSWPGRLNRFKGDLDCFT